MALRRLAWCVTLAGALGGSPVEDALQTVADELAKAYDISAALAVYGSYKGKALDAQASAGFVDGGLGMGPHSEPAASSDPYVDGSITKMFTAAAIFQLVENGTVGLDDPIATHVDPMLAPGSLAATVLKNDATRAATVTIRQCLHMTSGIGDYDAGNYAKEQFASPDRDFSPFDILKGGFVNASLLYPPGKYQDYSSTNYILLGLVAARYAVPGAATDPEAAWKAYDQLAVAPAAVRALMPRSRFADAGPCANFTRVHGYMQQYGGEPTVDAWDVSCVGGWTAGNYVGPVRDLAVFTKALYGGGGVVDATSLEVMTDWGDSRFAWYGAGTFKLDWSVGYATPAVGHVGDTYGYQSSTTYFPDYGFALTFASNAETTAQAQSGDAACRGFHALRAALGAGPKVACTFTVPKGRRFMGSCKCANATAV